MFQRKKRVLARLKDIQESLAASLNTFLVNLEKKLRAEFSKVAKLEEEFWAMKSQILWLVEGDRITTFYHTTALVHKRRNRILCMKDRMGNWINGDREIAEFIREGFLDLFTSSLSNSPLAKWNPSCWYTYLNEAEAINLDRQVSDVEISASLWVLKPFKTPGLDDLHAGFFQCFWLLVGESVKMRSSLSSIQGWSLSTLTRLSSLLSPNAKIQNR